MSIFGNSQDRNLTGRFCKPAPRSDVVSLSNPYTYFYFYSSSYVFIFILFQGSDFIGAFRSAERGELADAWDEIQHSHVSPQPRESVFEHIYDGGDATPLQPTLEGNFETLQFSLFAFL